MTTRERESPKMDDDDDDTLKRDAKDTTSYEELRESRRFYDSCHVANDVD